MAFIINNDQVITDLTQGQLSELFIDGTNVLQGDGLGNVTLRNVIIDANTIDTSSLTTDDIAEGANLYYLDSRVQTYLTTNAYATEAYVDVVDANLQSQIDALIISASGDIAQVQANLDAETLARISEDNNLQSQIDFIVSNTDQLALDSLTEIVAAFQNADSSIIGTVTSNTTAINNEIIRATSAESVLQININNEEIARISADNTLQSNIDAEETARISADNALQTNIDAEETARISADNTLQTNINAEVSARVLADNGLQANIDAEELARTTSDNTLQANIDAEEAARITAVAAEAASRLANDNTLQANIDAEEAARISAISAEEATRLANDNTLQANIDAEELRATTAEGVITTNLSSETSARISADNTLQSNIDTETTNRISGDSTTLASAISYTDGEVSILTAYVDSEIAAVGGTVGTLTTDDVTEGSNLYFTNTRARSALSASDGITYNSTTGAFTLTDTGVVAGSYGSASQVPVITVNANGQITSATSTAVAGVSSLTYTASTGVIDIGTSAGTHFTADLGVGTGDSPTFTNITATGNIQVDGDLTVSGTTTTITATNLAIADNMIYLNDGSTVTNPDIGFAGNYNDGTYAHTGVFRDASDGRWKFYDGYTLEPDAAIYIDTAHASFTLSDVQAANFIGNLTGNASTSTKLATARTISLTGDATGSASFDGSANATITVVVANDSHTHDGRYYTETEADARFANVTGDTFTGDVTAPTFIGNLTGNASTATKLATARTISLAGDATGSVSFDGSANATITVAVANDSHTHSTYLPYSGGTMTGYLTLNAGPTNALHAATKGYADAVGNAVISYTDSAIADLVNGADIAFDTLKEIQDSMATDTELANAIAGVVAGTVNNATKLTTARTISISGDATGSILFDGSANANMVLTIADDSHNHTIANIDGLQTALDGKQAAGSYISTVTNFAGDVSGPYNATVVANDSHTHDTQYYTKTQLTNGQLDTRYYTETEVDALISGVSGGSVASADKWTTARTISLSGDVTGSVSIDGSSNVTLTATVADNSHNHTNYAYYDHFRSLGVPAFTSVDTTTNGMIAEMEADGAFDSYTSAFKTSWSYAGNFDLTGAGAHAPVETAGMSFLTWTDNSSDTTRGNVTVLAIAPTTGSSAGGVYVYNDQGATYSPGWREIWTSSTDGAGSGLDADLLDGQQGSYYAPASHTHDYLPLIGGTLTGTLTLASGPTNSLDAATKGYADAVGNAVIADAETKYMRMQDLNGYDGMLNLQGSSNDWIRTTQLGIIPYQSGGHGSIGTSSWPFNTVYASTLYEGGTSLVSKYLLTTGKAADSNLLDGIDSAAFMRSNVDDTFTGKLSVGSTTTRQAGIYGIYDSTKTGHIWSMGTAYAIAADGTDFGNLYGFGYKHTNNLTGGTMAGGHQAVWCQNGTPYAALGTNIWTSGDVTAYSDSRVKTNLEKIDNALDKVLQLNGYTFERIDKDDDNRRYAGVIAQEVLEVLPEVVSGTEESHYSVAYGNMVALLIEGMKEQQSQIEALKAEIQALKDK